MSIATEKIIFEHMAETGVDHYTCGYFSVGDARTALPDCWKHIIDASEPKLQDITDLLDEGGIMRAEFKNEVVEFAQKRYAYPYCLIVGDNALFNKVTFSDPNTRAAVGGHYALMVLKNAEQYRESIRKNLAESSDGVVQSNGSHTFDKHLGDLKFVTEDDGWLLFYRDLASLGNSNLAKSVLRQAKANMVMEGSIKLLPILEAINYQSTRIKWTQWDSKIIVWDAQETPAIIAARNKYFETLKQKMQQQRFFNRLPHLLKQEPGRAELVFHPGQVGLVEYPQHIEELVRGRQVRRTVFINRL